VAHHSVVQLGVRPTRVFHSGKTRARQTAEAWGGLLNADVDQVDALAPNDDPTIWVERLQAEADDLMPVGHLPHLARLAGLLLTGASGRSVIRFRQGGLVALERTDTGWVVSAALPPEGGKTLAKSASTPAPVPAIWAPRSRHDVASPSTQQWRRRVAVMATQKRAPWLCREQG
jgi:phosphohistidine phosphatase